jgi:hypothetical protein
MKNSLFTSILICLVILLSCDRKSKPDANQPSVLVLGSDLSELNRQVFNPPIDIDANLTSWVCDVDQDGRGDLEFNFSFEPAPYQSAFLFQTAETKGLHIGLMHTVERDLIHLKMGDTLHYPGIDVYERKDSLNCNGEGILQFDSGEYLKLVPWWEGQRLDDKHRVSFGSFTYASLGANIVFPVSVLEGRPFHTSSFNLLQCDLFPLEAEVYMGFVMQPSGKLGYVKLRIARPLRTSIIEIAVQK